jgi:hypothetical protein
MADKEFLEKWFPSLWQDVVPIEKHSNLEPLSIPNHFQISVKQSATTIDDAMRVLLDLLPENDAPGTLVIGLDAECNVETSERGYVTGRGQTAILQIAYGTNIFILQVCHCDSYEKIDSHIPFNRLATCYLETSSLNHSSRSLQIQGSSKSAAVSQVIWNIYNRLVSQAFHLLEK